MRNADTPLVGGINKEVKTPQVTKQLGTNAPQTPNTLINQLESQQRMGSVFRIPTKRTGAKQTEGKDLVPLRDEFSKHNININVEINIEEADKAWEQPAKVKEVSEDNLSKTEEKVSIKELLQKIPKPQNEYNMDIPEIDEPEIKEIPEDMEDVENRDLQKRKLEQEEEEEKM